MAARKLPPKIPAPRCFAGGGVPQTEGERLIAEMNAKYGLGSSVRAEAPPPQPVQPQPAPVPIPTPRGGLLDTARNIFGNRAKQIDKAAGYAQGGKIAGPGTATSDSIGAEVRETGEPIRVSTGERILSVAQGRFLEDMANSAGYKSLDAMLEDATGKPVGPTIKAGKRAAENGLSPDEEKRPDLLNTAGTAPPTLGSAPFGRTAAAGGLTLQADPFGPEKSDPALDVAGLTKPGDVVGAITDTLLPRPGSGQSATPVSLPRPGSGRDANGTITADSAASAFSPEASRTNLGTMNLADQNERLAKSLGYAGTDDFNKQFRLRSDPEEQQADRAANGSPDAALRAATIRRGQDMRAETAADRIASNEFIAGERIAERVNRADKPKAPTLAQERSNLEIDQARGIVAGMSPEEIKRKSTSFTASGRENPDYDEAIARAAKLASRRKVGTDDDFDARQQGRPAGNDGDAMTRFRADKDMAGHKTGKMTEQGLEVFDGNGRLIGYYQ